MFLAVLETQLQSNFTILVTKIFSHLLYKCIWL